MLLTEYPLTDTPPPFPDDAVHDVKDVLDSSLPVIQSVFPSPTDPQITAPFKCVDETSEREVFSNTHDVMDTSLDASNAITGLEILTTLDGVKLTDTNVSIPEVAEKTEYPIEEFDGLNLIEDTVRSDPVELKRNTLNESDEENGFVTTASPSGLMFTVPLVNAE